MKGRVRRCTIEGTVPEIKTKNYELLGTLFYLVL